MSTNWTNPANAENVASSQNTFANYPLAAGTTQLSWITDGVQFPLATQTFFSGTPVSNPIIRLPSSLTGSKGTSFYLNNFLGPTFSRLLGEYTASAVIQIQDINGDNLTTLSVQQSCLITLQSQTNVESANWLVVNLTTPSTLATDLTTYVNGTTGIGLNAGGYLCQLANIIPVVLSDTSGPLTISQLNGNDVYVITDTSGCITTVPTIILPINSSSVNQTGMIATFKNVSQQTVLVQVQDPGGTPYYIDRDITGSSNSAPTPYGNTEFNLVVNGGVTLSYVGLITDPLSCYLYIIIGTTTTALSANLSYYYNLTSAPATINITDLAILNTTLLEFGQGAAMTYTVTLETTGPKLYFVAWSSNNNADTIIKIESQNGPTGGIATLSSSSPLQSFYIDINGNLIITNFTSSSISFASIADFNFPAGTGTTLVAIGADTFVYIMTTNVNQPWSYPHYIINTLLPTIQGLVFQPTDPVIHGVGTGAAGQWWDVTTGGVVTWSAANYNVVPGDKLVFINPGSGLELVVDNPARAGLKTTSVASSRAVVAGDIGTNLNITASAVTLSFPDPTSSPFATNFPTLPVGASQQATRTLITCPQADFGTTKLQFTNASDATVYNMWIWSNKTYVSTDGAKWYVEWDASAPASVAALPTIGTSTLGLNAFGGTIMVTASSVVTLPVISSPNLIAAYGNQPIYLLVAGGGGGTFTLKGPTGATSLVGAGFRVVLNNGSWFAQSFTVMT